MAIRSLDSLPTQPLPQPSIHHRRSAAGNGEGTVGGDGATTTSGSSSSGGGGADNAAADGESMKDVAPCPHHIIYPYITRY